MWSAGASTRPRTLTSTGRGGRSASPGLRGRSDDQPPRSSSGILTLRGEEDIPAPWQNGEALARGWALSGRRPEVSAHVREPLDVVDVVVVALGHDQHGRLAEGRAEPLDGRGVALGERDELPRRGPYPPGERVVEPVGEP